MNVGILHPGEMGASVGYAAGVAGNEVYWLDQGRSARTRARAKQAKLKSCASLSELGSCCELLISICPPAASISVAEDVARSQFDGIFVEANAISPQKSCEIAGFFKDTAINYVDGGLIGPPAWDEGTTRLYLSGPQAIQVQQAMKGGPLEARVIDDHIGSASAMKQCFAAFTKGKTALIAEVLAAAEHYGVAESLSTEWGVETTQSRINNIQRIADRAWRWEGEMHEIADTLEVAGLPDGIHRAAAEIYARLAAFRNCEQPPEWTVLRAKILTKRGPDGVDLAPALDGKK